MWLGCFTPSKLPHMTPKDKLTLSWWEKWTLYALFHFHSQSPSDMGDSLGSSFYTYWSLLFLPLWCFLFTKTMRIPFLRYVHEDIYLVANLNTFYDAFYPPSFQPSYGFNPNENKVFFYSIDTTVEAVNYSVVAVRTRSDVNLSVLHLSSIFSEHIHLWTIGRRSTNATKNGRVFLSWWTQCV